jgi:hypothetical protein
MKVSTIAVVCAAALLPALAHAEASSAQLLGGADAVVNFCSKVDPGKAQGLEARILRLVGLGKLPDDTVAKTRKDPEYRRVYDLIEDYLSQQTSASAKQGCAWLIEQSEPVPSPKSRPGHPGPHK